MLSARIEYASSTPQSQYGKSRYVNKGCTQTPGLVHMQVRPRVSTPNEVRHHQKWGTAVACRTPIVLSLLLTMRAWCRCGPDSVPFRLAVSSDLRFFLRHVFPEAEAAGAANDEGKADIAVGEGDTEEDLAAWALAKTETELATALIERVGLGELEDDAIAGVEVVVIAGSDVDGLADWAEVGACSKDDATGRLDAIAAEEAIGATTGAGASPTAANKSV